MQCSCMMPAPVHRTGARQVARETGAGEQNAVLAVRRGLPESEEETG